MYLPSLPKQIHSRRLELVMVTMRLWGGGPHPGPTWAPEGAGGEWRRDLRGAVGV